MAHTRAPALLATFFGFLLTTIAVVGITIASFIYIRSEQTIEKALDGAVRQRTQSAALDLARTLESDWRDLQFLAQALGQQQTQSARALMAGMRGDGTRIAWIGFAGLDGHIIAATNDMLVGEDVHARPWFQSGLEGDFGGDVHDAVLLANLMGGAGPNPLHFLDLARPVVNAQGQTIGVVGVHINAAWLQNYLAQTAKVLGADLFLVGPDGSISVSSVDSDTTSHTTDIARIARTGAELGVREEWANGRSYYAALVPRVGFGDLPNFGWRLIGRIDVQALAPTFQALRMAGAILIATTSLAIAGLGMAYLALFLRPISMLSKAAKSITQGGQEYPPTPTTTREAIQLAGALVALQHARQDPPTPSPDHAAPK